ncbi:unnamed protein product, partial [Symbiodinium sp. CCMP2456]
MFAMHLKHINVTESTMMDATTVLEDKNKPILEEMFQGFRVEMDVALTKALEKVITEKILQQTAHANALTYQVGRGTAAAPAAAFIPLCPSRNTRVTKTICASSTGASSDMRLSYDDAKRRELFQSVPFLNVSFNDIVAKLSVPVDHMLSVYHGLTVPWLGPL